MKKNSLRVLLGLMMALVLVLVACAPTDNSADSGGADANNVTPNDDASNDNNNDDASEDAQPSGFVQGVTDDAIYFANSTAVSGALAVVGVPFQAGMNAYIEMINSQGGVHGRQLRYIHVDDEFQPGPAVAALERFIYDDEVFALVGHFGSVPIGATLPIIIENGIPTVYFAAGIGDVYNENATDGNGRNTFPVQPVFPMEARIFAAWAAGEFEAQRIGIIYTNDDVGLDFLSGLTQEADAIGGLEIVAAQVEPNVEDVTAAVATIMEGDVDIVVVGAIQGTFPQIVRGLAAQGNTSPVLASYVNADILMSQMVASDVGDQFDVFASAWVEMDNDNMALYREWVAQVSSEDLSNNSFAMTGWIAMHFFVEGLERAGVNLTWQSFIEAMESAPIQNPFGPAIDFANGNRVGTQDLALVRLNADAEAGWEGFLPFMSIEEILN